MRKLHEGSTYITAYGWSNTIAEQAVAASRQTAILRHTPNDAARRFKNVTTAKDWHNSIKAPEVYSLHDRAGQQLVGLAWFSWQQNELLTPEYNATFAIRLYDNARGKHLSYPFAASVHADFEQQQQQEKLSGLWLETNSDNQPAQHLYRQLGYVTARQIDNRLLMTKNIEKM